MAALRIRVTAATLWRSLLSVLRGEKDMVPRWRGCVAAALFTLVTMAAHAADPVKVLRVAFQTDVTGFDPQVASEVYSLRICRAIFDSLLQYDYLERPYALKPSTAQALP